MEGHGRAWKGMEGHGRAWKWGDTGRSPTWLVGDDRAARAVDEAGALIEILEEHDLQSRKVGGRSEGLKVGEVGRRSRLMRCITCALRLSTRAAGTSSSLSSHGIEPVSVACHCFVLPGRARSWSRLCSSAEVLCGKSFVGTTGRVGGLRTAWWRRLVEKLERRAHRISFKRATKVGSACRETNVDDGHGRPRKGGRCDEIR